MIICEIGLNHCGDTGYADEYIDALLEARPDGLTFQIREKEYYQSLPESGLLLPDDYYKKVAPRIKSEGIRFGMAICDPDKVEFCEEIGADFYKVIRNDISNFDLTSKLLSTGKRVFVSTGMADIKEIESFVKAMMKHRNQITLVHTQLSHSLGETNLKAISVLKNKFNLPIAFGSHAADHNVLFMSLCFEPSDVFFYVKGGREMRHRDNEHAIDLSHCGEMINNLRKLAQAVGDGKKMKMGIKIKDMIR